MSTAFVFDPPASPIRRRSPQLAFLLTSVVLLFVSPPASEGQLGRAVDGRDRLVVMPPEGAVVDTYENDGYRLTVAGDRAVVEVDLAPLRSRAPFELGTRSSDPDRVEILARSLVSGARTRYQASSRILSWVARNVRYELDRSASQTAPAVLERRTAYCTGVSRLTVALLESVGIESREVSGYVVDPSLGGRGGYHRWVEIWFPERGWVFSDPLTTHHYVPATYLRLAADELDLSRSHEARVLGREDQVHAVDVVTWGPERILVRRNGGRRRAAAVSLDLPTWTAGQARLEGAGEVRVLDFHRGRGSFVGLSSAVYRLEVTLYDGDPFERVMELERPVHAVVRAPEAEGASRRSRTRAVSEPAPSPRSAPGEIGAAGGGRSH